VFGLLRECLECFDHFFSLHFIFCVSAFNQRDEGELFHGVFVFEVRLGGCQEETVLDLEEAGFGLNVVDCQTVESFAFVDLGILEAVDSERHQEILVEVAGIDKSFSMVISNPNVDCQFRSKCGSGDLGHEQSDGIDLLLALEVDPLAVEVAVDLLCEEEAVDGTSGFQGGGYFGLLINVVGVDQSVVFFTEIGCFKDKFLDVVFQSEQIVVFVSIFFDVLGDPLQRFGVRRESEVSVTCDLFLVEGHEDLEAAFGEYDVFVDQLRHDLQNSLK
jgi:hypothetical protein